MKKYLFVAFLGGAALASGIVYVVLKPELSSPKVAASSPQSEQVRTAKEAKDLPEASRSNVVSAPTTNKPESIYPLHSEQAKVRSRSSLPSSQTPRHVEAVSPAPPTVPTVRKRTTYAERAPVVWPLPVNTRTSSPPDPPVPPYSEHPTSDLVTTAAPVVNDPPPPPPVDASYNVKPTIPLRPEPSAASEARTPNTLTIPQGTALNVRLEQNLSSKQNRVGDAFTASLTEPLVVNGWVIAEKGARADGRVVDSDVGGRVRGVSRLSIELLRLHTSDGQQVRIHTSSFDRQAKASGGEDAAKVGAGAAIGAAIGAIAGGGKGAGIGAGVGGAAGAGDVLLTRGKPADIAAETRLSFRTTEPVTITEKLNQ